MIVVLLSGNVSSQERLKGRALLQDIERVMIEDSTEAKRLLDISQDDDVINRSISMQSYRQNLVAYHQIVSGDFTGALENLQIARQLAIDSNNRIQEAESYRREGIIYIIIGQYPNALTLYSKSIELHTQENSPRLLYSIDGILNIYEILEQYEQLIEYSWILLEKSLELSSYDDAASAHHNLGLGFLAQNDLAKARYHFNEEKKALEKVTDELPFGVTNHGGFARLELAEGNLDKALTHIQDAQEWLSDTNFDYGKAASLIIESDIRIAMGQIELATQLLNRAVFVGEETQQTSEQLDALAKLAALYQSQGDFENAFLTLQQFQQLEEASLLESERRLLAINQARLDLDTKNREIEELRFEQRLNAQEQSNKTTLLFSALLVITILVFSTLRQSRQKKALRQTTAELQKATDAKSDFLARMSHEIRTPINAIIGLTKLSLRGSESERQATNLKQIDESSQTLLGIINDILDFSKIEAGKMAIESASFNIDEVITRSIRLNALKAQEKDIELIQFVSRDVPLHVEGDALRLQQVLNNLLSNAVKFTDDGSISVVVKRQYSEKGLVLLFEVKDTGRGLTMAQKASLFDSFTQADESITRKYGGTGLGLAISKQLVELMGGDIWVESIPSQGATFSFTIKVKASRDNELPKVTKQQLSKMRVLVIDDAELSRQFIAEALLRMNINPDVVSDGHQGIHKLRLAEQDKAPYDLVLLDWKMPDVDGIEIASIIRQEFNQSQPNIVMLSSYDLSAIKALGQPLGINGYLEKPLNTSALLDCVSQLLDGNRKITGVLPSSRPDTPNFNQLRILLAEDNELNQKVAMGYLKTTHAKVTIAENGEEAIKILKQDPSFDLILMDIQMPFVDGLSATQIIRGELGLKTPIIAMTAHAMAGDVEKSLAAGMNAHVVKPIEPESLFNTMQELLGLESKVPTKAPVSKSTNTEKLIPLDAKSLLSIDKEQAIKALHDEPTLYEELLQDFVNLEDKAHTLKRALTEQDLPTIRDIVHAYKPSLSYIGAYSLALSAKELEINLKGVSVPLEQDVAQQIQSFLEAVLQLTMLIKQERQSN